MPASATGDRRFADRADAGRRLASALSSYLQVNPLVCGLPRGGVVVAAAVAAALGAELDVLIVRKLGAPFQPELALGAVGEDGVCVINEDVANWSGLSPDAIHTLVASAANQLRIDSARLRRVQPAIARANRTLIVVDDGIATGATCRAACAIARADDADTIVVAVPVCPSESLAALQAVADAVVCLATPNGLGAVGDWYDDFTPTSDDEVMVLLARGRGQPGGPSGS